MSREQRQLVEIVLTLIPWLVFVGLVLWSIVSSAAREACIGERGRRETEGRDS
jgi:hypothetical protein